MKKIIINMIYMLGVSFIITTIVAIFNNINPFSTSGSGFIIGKSAASVIPGFVIGGFFLAITWFFRKKVWNGSIILMWVIFILIIVLSNYGSYKLSLAEKRNQPDKAYQTVTKGSNDSITRTEQSKGILSPETIAEMTLNNTVSIIMQDRNRQTLSLGSGVILDNGKVITNVHVISGATYGFVQKFNSQISYDIDGYFILDKYNDLVLLSVPEINTQNRISIKNALPRVGERIYAAGNPQGLSGTFTEGIVSAIRSSNNNSLIQISAPISPGSSGGAIVNALGELIGIALGGIEAGQNLNFAIPSRVVDSILKINSENRYDIYTAKGSNVVKKGGNIKDNVLIKNVLWYHDCGEYNARNEADNPLVEFSIYNKLSVPIYDITIAIIIYDKDNLPVDYQYIKTSYAFGKVAPGLARKFKNIRPDYSDYLGWQSNRIGEIRVSKKRGYRAEFRVLDYKISK